MKDIAALLLRLAEPGAPLPELPDWSEERWAILGRLAGQHRVEAWLSQRMDDGGVHAPPSEQWTRQRHSQKLRMAAMHRDYTTMVQRFTAVGITAIPLKGIDLAVRIYPDPGLRPFEDLDVLIPSHQIDVARTVMLDLGYRVPDALLPVSWIRRFHFHLPFLHPDTRTFVELHWALADGHTLPAAATEQAVRESAATGHLPDDLYAVYLLAHLGKHGCLNQRLAGYPEPGLALHPFSDVRLIWFVDLCLLLQRTSLTVDAIEQRADALGITTSTRTGLYLLHHLFPSFAAGIAPPQPGKEGLIERTIKNKLLRDMKHALDHDSSFPSRLPWILRTHPRLHVRPIRAFSHGP